MAKETFRELGRRFKQGRIIYSQGDVAENLFVVQKGRVEIVLETSEGEIPLHVYEKGDIFGEVALFAGKARFTTARADGDTRVLKVDEKTFVSKLHQDPSLAYRMLRQMANRIYDLHHELIHRYHTVHPLPRDELTGMVAFANAEEMLDQAVVHAKKILQTMAFAVIDLDNVKLLQKEYGETVGETLFLALSDILRQFIRRSDLSGRYGKDRFPVILYETDGATAVKVLENVRSHFAEEVHEIEDKQFQATFSCGIAAFPEHGTATELHKAANAALDLAKKQGRNQIVLAVPGFIRGDE